MSLTTLFLLLACWQTFATPSHSLASVLMLTIQTYLPVAVALALMAPIVLLDAARRKRKLLEATRGLQRQIRDLAEGDNIARNAESLLNEDCPHELRGLHDELRVLAAVLHNERSFETEDKVSNKPRIAQGIPNN